MSTLFTGHSRGVSILEGVIITALLGGGVSAVAPLSQVGAVGEVTNSTPQAEEIKKLCEQQISEAMSHAGASLPHTQIVGSGASAAVTETSKCVGAALDPVKVGQNMPLDAYAKLKQDKSSYRCTGRIATVTFSRVAGTLTIETRPDESKASPVPPGTCKTQVCESGVCHAISFGGNALMNTWFKNSGSLSSNPAAGAVGTADNPISSGATSNLNDGLANLENTIKTKKQGFCSDADATCYFNIPQEDITKAGLSGTNCSDGTCRVSPDAALQAIAQAKKGEPIAPAATFAPDSGLTKAADGIVTPKPIKPVDIVALSSTNNPAPGLGANGASIVPDLKSQFNPKTNTSGFVQNPANQGSGASGGGLSSELTPGDKAAQAQAFGFLTSSGAAGGAANASRSTLGNLPVSSLFSSVGKFLGCIVSLGFYCHANP